MTEALTEAQLRHHERLEAESTERVMFGFWIYLMTDLLMFAVLFACYAVLHGNTAGEETGRQLFSQNVALSETLLLLTSSFTCGVAMVNARLGKKAQTLWWLGVTFVLGLLFLKFELKEFAEFISEGHTMKGNAFLSSFFILVGTHGLHITSGLLWMLTTMIFTAKRGLTKAIVRKLSMLSLFWHFLDIVWIFIFTIVYMGAFV